MNPPYLWPHADIVRAVITRTFEPYMGQKPERNKLEMLFHRPTYSCQPSPLRRNTTRAEFTEKGALGKLE